VFLVACAASDDTIDRTFDPCAFDVADVATDAVALWNLERTPGAPMIDVQFEDAAPAFHGHYDDERGIVLINSAITEPHALSVVIAHELGHAFGLPHIGDRASVMNRGNLAIEPTAEDRALISSCAPPRS